MATHLLILIYTGMRINEYLSLEDKVYDVKELLSELDPRLRLEKID